ncbi:MAG: SAM-dependent methyltransferase [Marinilabiliales bacterium]|nr:MAG: SAM-dependent methyltransferase [Marinilabiliales bacterium]
MENEKKRYFWDERYASEEYIYGTEPNKFFAGCIAEYTPGKILFPAEGEGRNAVYAAKHGWEVTAFDLSIEGKRKAERLAQSENVSIDYLHGGFEDMPFPPASFDCVVLIYAHFPKHRELYHKMVSEWLKPGGVLILEGFEKAQKNRSTGGPGNSAMLFSREEMKIDFQSLSKLTIEEKLITLDEGELHVGVASVIRVLGIK